jgi:membrane protein DedA with SNARE-associated domain
MFTGEALTHLLQHYGYGLVGTVICLEAMGLPFPGESMIIGAAIYAATTGGLDITLVVASAASGAILGDNFGYLIGNKLGFRLLEHYGKRVGLTERRLTLGRYLFKRHGGKVIFTGRFIAILRTFVALMAGAARMDWKSFLFYNAVGGIAWSSLYGFGAYALGESAKGVSGPLGVGLAVLAAIVLVAAIVFLRRNEQRLEDRAEREMNKA